MPVETRELSIQGHTVKVVPFNAARGFVISAKLTKPLLPILGTVLPTLTKAAAEGKEELSIGDINIDELLPVAFQKLSEQIDPEDLFQLLLDLLSGSFVDGDMIDRAKFDTLFIGNYSLAYRIAFEVIKANHFFDLGVFSGILNKLPALKALTGKGK